MKETDAYKPILARHFQVLWKVLHWSKDKNLLSAIDAHDSITRLAFHDSTRLILEAAMKGEKSPGNGPFAKVLLGGFAKANQTSHPS